MSIINVINQVTDEKLIDVLHKYEEKWNFDVTATTFIEMIQHKLELDDLNDLDKVNQAFECTNKILITIGSELKKRNLIDTKENIEILLNYNRLLEKIHYAKHMLLHFVHYERSRDAGHDYNANVDTTMFKFIPVVYDELKPLQKLLYKVIDFLDRSQYRRVNETCYEEIRVNGYGTHAWKPRCTIMETINTFCNMITDFGNWKLLTSSRDLDKQINDHLLRTMDPRFPILKKDRNVFSFRNGIYFSYCEGYTDAFVRYDSDEYNTLDKNIVSCKYFDIDFEYTEPKIDPNDIQTPTLNSIYNYQNLTPDVIVINKMLLGRMLYNVGQLDNWQIIPFLLGSGGTGKSTINNIVRTFYDHEDVGIMGNNYQKTFGLADIYDKFAFIAPEIKRDWGIDQAEFQEIVSGGKINVNIKHKPSVRVEWTAPGMLGGNENPGFVDNACSIQRRVVVTRFDRKVMKGDPQLSKKLESEIGAIMRQCNLYYLQYASKYCNKDIWNVLPEYYLETQRLMASASNALFAFMDSDLVEYGEELYIPMDEFFKRFNIYCSENNLQKPKINIDFYRSPFSKYNLEVQTRTTKKYLGRAYKNTNFIIGADLKKIDDFDDF